MDSNNFWQVCFTESTQLKDGRIFHLTLLLFCITLQNLKVKHQTVLLLFLSISVFYF